MLGHQSDRHLIGPALARSPRHRATPDRVQTCCRLARSDYGSSKGGLDGRKASERAEAGFVVGAMARGTAGPADGRDWPKR